MTAGPTAPLAPPVPRSAFVLVPGIGHGGWAWHPVARRLRAAGHVAVTVTLPGTADGDDPAAVGTEDAVAHLVDLVTGRDLHDVVLVAHSWAGYPVTGAAHRLSERVRAVVYLSGVVPRRGKSMLDEFPPEVAQMVRGVLAASPDGAVPVTFEDVAQTFMQDQPEAAQRLLFELLTPVPGRYVTEGVDVEPVTSAGLRAVYVLAEDDRGLVRPGHEFAARIGVEPVMVPGPHEVLLTDPDAVARALLAAAGPVGG